jgi:hypothetical protein
MHFLPGIFPAVVNPSSISVADEGSFEDLVYDPFPSRALLKIWFMILFLQAASLKIAGFFRRLWLSVFTIYLFLTVFSLKI